MERKFGRNDIVIIAVLALLILLSFLSKMIIFGEKGEFLVVAVDGSEQGRYPLSEDYEGIIETDYGRNVFVIKDGAAFMKEADCRDGLCMHQGKISGKGQTVVCLPHRVVLSVEGAAASGPNASDENVTYDGVAK